LARYPLVSVEEIMSLRRRLLTLIQTLIAKEPLPLRLVLWDGEVFDFAAEPRVTLTIRSPSIMRAFVTGRIARLGDAYVAGDLTVDGTIDDILRIGITLAERTGRLSRLARLMRALQWAATFRHSKRNDAAAIQHYYDVSNDFYRLWLDHRMTYSCAYFHTGTEDIDGAQEQKLEHICCKLRLMPGDHVLDVGCGWGGFLRLAADRYGITGVGVTNSAAQCDFAKELIADAGLSDRIEIRLQDYRDLAGQAAFDKIVSVGMYEHVGFDNLPLYFSTIARLLKPGGALLNHGIITTNPDGRPQGPPGGEFINRYVFPGGELPHLPRLLAEMARSRLEAVDVEDLRPHYARTLLLWVRRLEAHKQRAIETAGPERYRIWRVYLAGMAHAFDRGWLSVTQTLAYKGREGRPAPRPWSRGYQYRLDGATALASALDWNVTPPCKSSSDDGTFLPVQRLKS
jgi:cyclopropane-fatty-acyl-phospholipid synthase